MEICESLSYEVRQMLQCRCYSITALALQGTQAIKQVSRNSCFILILQGELIIIKFILLIIINVLYSFLFLLLLICYLHNHLLLDLVIPSYELRVFKYFIRWFPLKIQKFFKVPPEHFSTLADIRVGLEEVQSLLYSII